MINNGLTRINGAILQALSALTTLGIVERNMILEPLGPDVLPPSLKTL